MEVIVLKRMGISSNTKWQNYEAHRSNKLQDRCVYQKIALSFLIFFENKTPWSFWKIRRLCTNSHFLYNIRKNSHLLVHTFRIYTFRKRTRSKAAMHMSIFPTLANHHLTLSPLRQRSIYQKPVDFPPGGYLTRVPPRWKSVTWLDWASKGLGVKKRGGLLRSRMWELETERLLRYASCWWVTSTFFGSGFDEVGRRVF